ncbi:MAG: hypothetical protein JOZ39_08450, partial [Chloroflexi bacterium]|nr:hypothetical protein [Chloroflexota bacterium]
MEDNAFALVAVIRAHQLDGDNGLLDFIRHYLDCLERCQLDDGSFGSHLTDDGVRSTDAATAIEQAAAIWGLAAAALESRQLEVRLRALTCLDRVLVSPSVARSVELDLGARAFTLTGCLWWARAEPATRLADCVAGLRHSLLRAAELPTHCGGQPMGPAPFRLSEALFRVGANEAGLRVLTNLAEDLGPDANL